ncbi:uncharacterized protein [Penaeus vannamei]|uniref:uncharacterized protein n=1 Tax=Penaeus vannamei TaxID=6689 RepID=UPI00387FA4CA
MGLKCYESSCQVGFQKGNFLHVLRSNYRLALVPDIRRLAEGTVHSPPPSAARRKCFNSSLLITMSQTGRPATRGDAALNTSGLDKDSDPKGCVGDKSQDNSDSTTNKATMYSSGIKGGDGADTGNGGGRGEMPSAITKK